MATVDVTMSHEELEKLIEESVKHALSVEKDTSKNIHKQLCVYHAKKFAHETLAENAHEGIFECYKDVVIDRCKQAALLIAGSLFDFVLKNLLIVVCVAGIIALVSIVVFISRKCKKSA